MRNRNLTLLMDFYELTMGNGYLANDIDETVAYFDVYFRKIPDAGGFVVMAGLEQIIDYLKNITFDEDDISYLKSRNMFSAEFLNYLRNFTFTCDVWAVPEGRPVFPGEPVMTIRGPVIQVQMLETMVLLNLNHQCLIATKSCRIVRAAEGRSVMEFGSRRAHGADAAINGARAAYIGGVIGSANTLTDRDMQIPALGTMAHSWVQLFDDEYLAFKAYAETYPQECTLLVDTYDVLHSGLPNAIRVFDEVIVPKGFRPKGVRIDSGDMAYLSKRARQMLDDAGYTDVGIVASGGLDEYIIRDLLLQGAKIDSFGVGERLITARSEPVFGGVFKLVAVEDKAGHPRPRIKISENIEKITTPGYKKPWRLFDRESGKAIADVITLADETISETEPFVLFDPNAVWKRKTVSNFRVESLQVPIFKGGTLVYDCPSVQDIRSYCAEEIGNLWEEVRRFENPHTYYVDFSLKLWQLREDMLMRHKMEVDK